MPAVQLSVGQQIYRCDDGGQPRGKPNRMEHYIPAGGNRTETKTVQPLEQQRVAERQAAGRHRTDVRQEQARDEERQEHDESGDRPGDADVENRLSRRERLPDADHGAERPGERERCGKKERQRRVHL